MDVIEVLLSEGRGQGSWNKSARRSIRAGFMPRKPLTLAAAANALWLGVGLAFITPLRATRRARGLGRSPKVSMSMTGIGSTLPPQKWE